LGRIAVSLARQQHHHQNSSVAVATPTAETNDYNNQGKFYKKTTRVK